MDEHRISARRELESLHKGIVVELDRRFTYRPGPDHSAVGRAPSDVDAEVASTIGVIQQAASVLGELQATIRRQEESLYDQRQVIAELQHHKAASMKELATAERVLKAEQERAARAEQRLQACEAQVRRVEDHNAALKNHLGSLMGVVRESLAAGEGQEAGTRTAI